MTLSNRYIHPAGGGGQVDDQATWLQILQLLPAQQEGGGGVNNEVVGAQPAPQLVGALGVVSPDLRPGQIIIAAGRHGDMGAQALELVGQHPAQPSGAQKEDPGGVEGDGKLLHGELDGPLPGG